MITKRSPICFGKTDEAPICFDLLNIRCNPLGIPTADKGFNVIGPCLLPGILFAA